MTDLQVKFEKIEAKLQPLESKRSASKRIMKEFDIPAGSVQSLSPCGHRSSTLSGKWRSSGEVRRGADDSISGFTLSDLSDAVLDSAFRKSSGSFIVKVFRPASTRSSSRTPARSGRRRDGSSSTPSSRRTSYLSARVARRRASSACSSSSFVAGELKEVEVGILHEGRATVATAALGPRNREDLEDREEH